MDVDKCTSYSPSAEATRAKQLMSKNMVVWIAIHVPVPRLCSALTFIPTHISEGPPRCDRPGNRTSVDKHLR